MQQHGSNSNGNPVRVDKNICAKHYPGGQNQLPGAQPITTQGGQLTLGHLADTHIQPAYLCMPVEAGPVQGCVAISILHLWVLQGDSKGQSAGTHAS